MNARGPSGGSDSLLGPRIVAGLLVVGAVFLLYQALQIGQVTGYNAVGPSSIPLAVSGVLLVLGLTLAVRTTLRPDHDLAERVADEERATHWTSVGLLLGVLVVYGLALNGFRVGPVAVPGLGYVVATALFVPMAARVLGSDHPLRDLAVGVGMAVVVYIGFTQFLGVRLPPGVLRIFG